MQLRREFADLKVSDGIKGDTGSLRQCVQLCQIAGVARDGVRRQHALILQVVEIVFDATINCD